MKQNSSIKRGFRFEDGIVARFTIMDEHTTRLRRECFPERGCTTAGTIFAWPTLEAMIDDHHFRRLFMAALESPMERCMSEPIRVRLTLKFSEPIGFASAIPLSEVPYPLAMLEDYTPNNRSSVKAVKRSYQESFPAPKTLELTCVVSIRIGTNFEGVPQWQLAMYTCYPGPDLGKLQANITDRSGLVLFRFGYKGAMNPVENPVNLRPKNLFAIKAKPLFDY